jgi:NAD(P)-dependent dehydrogenase (short-subunit alcohol dehydrogenase family)
MRILPRLDGKVCLITGGTSGIGKATALGLNDMGATIIVVGRDLQRGMDTAKALNTLGHGDACFLEADFLSQASIRKLADTVMRKYSHVDVVIHNAGLVSKDFSLSEDGIEKTFAVNHIAPFLLTNLFLPMLRAQPSARIITVSSLVHRWGTIHFDDVNLTKNYDIDRAYNQSKLANVLFTYELARRMEGTRVTANALEPGQVNTTFGAAYGGVRYWLAKHIILPLFGKTPAQAAETSIYLAASTDVDATSGWYFANCRAIHSSQASYDTLTAQRLWELSEQLTSL